MNPHQNSQSALVVHYDEGICTLPIPQTRYLLSSEAPSQFLATFLLVLNVIFLPGNREASRFPGRKITFSTSRKVAKNWLGASEDSKYRVCGIGKVQIPSS